MKVIRRLRQFRALHYVKIALGAVAAILAVAVVTSITVDLGPVARGAAENLGKNAWKRPIHIGRLSIRLFGGRVVVDDFSIEGLEPADRPFFTAKRLEVALDWSTLIQRAHPAQPEITITSVELTDWEMLAERWEDRSNFPKFANNDEPGGPEAFHDDAEVSARVARTIHLPRSRSAVERGCPQHRHQHGQPAEVSRNGELHAVERWRSRTTAVLGEHEGALRDRRQPDSPQSDRLRHRRRQDDGHRRRRFTQLAPAVVPIQIACAVCPHASAVLQGRAMGSVRRRRLHRPVPAVQRRPRARSVRHVFQPVVRRRRLSVLVAVRRAALDP